MNKLIVTLICISSILLCGCGERLDEIKDAISGIDSKADEAALALSTDVHTLRAIELSYNDSVFTVNDLFKTILRDVQWVYSEEDGLDVLKINGTWKDGLFSNYDFTTDEKSVLTESGKVSVTLIFEENQLLDENTNLEMIIDDHTVVSENGKIALNSLYNGFLNH